MHVDVIAVGLGTFPFFDVISLSARGPRHLAVSKKQLLLCVFHLGVDTPRNCVACGVQAPERHPASANACTAATLSSTWPRSAGFLHAWACYGSLDPYDMIIIIGMITGIIIGMIGIMIGTVS